MIYKAKYVQYYTFEEEIQKIIDEWNLEHFIFDETKLAKFLTKKMLDLITSHQEEFAEQKGLIKIKACAFDLEEYGGKIHMKIEGELNDIYELMDEFGLYESKELYKTDETEFKAYLEETIFILMKEYICIPKDYLNEVIKNNTYPYGTKLEFNNFMIHVEEINALAKNNENYAEEKRKKIGEKLENIGVIVNWDYHKEIKKATKNIELFKYGYE